MVRFNLLGLKKKFPFDEKKVLREVLKELSKELRLADHLISFIICSGEEIRNINRDYRHIDKETDVISFAEVDSSPDRTLPYELGEVFINYERVYLQAKDYGHSELREYAFLALHGSLHLLGYDHMTKEDEEIMFSLQDKILDNIGIRKE